MPQYNPVSGLTGSARQNFYTPQPTQWAFGGSNPARSFNPATGQYVGGVGNQTAAAPGGPTLGSYSDILGGDPLYQQTLADLGAQNVGDREGLKSARQRAVVQFGEVPDFSALDQTAVGSDFAGDIDQPTRLLAGKNTQEGLSVAARIAKQNSENVRTLTNYLSSRGLLRSGEAGYRLGEEQQNYKTAQYDSRQKLLDFLGQYQSGYMQGLAQRRAAQTQAAGGAFDRSTAIYGNTDFGPAPSPAAGPPVPNQPPRPPQNIPGARPPLYDFTQNLSSLVGRKQAI